MIYVYVCRQCHRADDFGDFTIWLGYVEILGVVVGGLQLSPRPRPPSPTGRQLDAVESSGSDIKWVRLTANNVDRWTTILPPDPATTTDNCNNNILNNTLMYVTVAADDVRKRTGKWISLRRGLRWSFVTTQYSRLLVPT